jgi:hypothetical protein
MDGAAGARTGGADRTFGLEAGSIALSVLLPMVPEVAGGVVGLRGINERAGSRTGTAVCGPPTCVAIGVGSVTIGAPSGKAERAAGRRSLPETKYLAG